MSIPLLACSSSNILAKNPTVATSRSYQDGSAHFASANKEYLTIPSNSSLQTGDIDFEIGGWVRFDSVGYMRIATKDGGTYREYAMQMLPTTNNISFGLWNEAGVSKSVADSTSRSINTWYFIRGWHNATSNTLNIQINNGTITSTDTTGFVPSISNGIFMFGKSALFNSEYLNGRLDSWYFTKRISTTAEATALYNDGAGRTYEDLTEANGLATFKAGLTSWYNFNSESGTQYDSHGTNHLTATADPIIAPPAYGSELIANGGFETAGSPVFANWGLYEGTGTISKETTIVHGGSSALKIAEGPTGSIYAYQSFSVTAGASYFYSFWSRGDSTYAGTYFVYDVTNSVNIVNTITTGNKTTTYQLFTGQFTAPASCTTARFYLNGGAANSIAYFDDVSVKQIVTPSINNGGFDLRPATGGEKTNVSTVSRSRTSNVATMVATAHGLKNNDVVTITGMTDTTFNGTNKTVTVVDVDTFTYASTGSDAGSAGDTGGRIATDVFSSWTEALFGATTLVAETTAPYAGICAARLDIDASNSDAILSQNTILGKKYSYSFYAKANTGAPTLAVGDGSIGANTTLSTSYSLYSGAYTASVYAKFVIERGVSTSKSIYIDQVTLTSLGPTAEAGIASGNATDGNFAAGFKGSSSQYLTRASSAGLQGTTPNWGVGCWTYLNSKATQQVLIAKGTSLTAAANLEYALYYDSITDKFKFSISDGTDIVTATSTASSPALNTWYYVRGYRSDTGVIGISVNNGTADTASTALNSQVVSGVFAIGNIAGGSLAINGRIDAAYKMNRLFTAGELTALYNSGKGVKYAQLSDSLKNDGLLMGWWNLDELSGNYADSASGANTLTNNGTVTQVQGVNYYEGAVSKLTSLTSSFNQVTLAKRPTYSSLMLNGSILFDGVDDGLVMTGDKIGVGDVTVCAVINARSTGASGRIIDNTNFLMLTSSTGTSSIAVYSASVTGSYAITTPNSINFNTSYIVIVTRTSAGIVNIYINGVLSGTANQNSGTPVAGSDTYIGNRAAGDRAFDGYIGKVGVINRILSLGEIQAVSRRLSIEAGGIY